MIRSVTAFALAGLLALSDPLLQSKYITSIMQPLSQR